MDSAGCPHRMALTEQAGNRALLWSTSKTCVPQLSLPDSVSLADVSAELGNLQVPSRGRRKSQKAEKTEKGRLTAALLGKMITSWPRKIGQEAEG